MDKTTAIGLALLISIFAVLIILNVVKFASCEQSYIIDGDRVYVDDENIFLQTEPHTIYSSSWVYFNLTSKRLSGDIDAVWGFDTDYAKPVKALLYKPHFENTTCSYQCQSDYFNYTWLGKGADNHFWCWNNVSKTSNATAENYTEHVLVYEHSFEWATLASKTAFWNDTEFKDYRDISNKFTSVAYEHGGMDKWWYIKNVNVVPNASYQLKAYIQVPIQLGSASGKYWFCVKQSNLTMSEAIAAGRFYCLDPWFSSNYNKRRPITVTCPHTTVSNVMVNLTFNSAGNSTLHDSRDVRIVDDSNTEVNAKMLFPNCANSTLIFNVSSCSAGDTLTYYVYYDYAAATMPTYWNDSLGNWTGYYGWTFDNQTIDSTATHFGAGTIEEANAYSGDIVGNKSVHLADGGSTFTFAEAFTDGRIRFKMFADPQVGSGGTSRSLVYLQNSTPGCKGILYVADYDDGKVFKFLHGASCEYNDVIEQYTANSTYWVELSWLGGSTDKLNLTIYNDTWSNITVDVDIPVAGEIDRWYMDMSNNWLNIWLDDIEVSPNNVQVPTLVLGAEETVALTYQDNTTKYASPHIYNSNQSHGFEINFSIADGDIDDCIFVTNLTGTNQTFTKDSTPAVSNDTTTVHYINFTTLQIANASSYVYYWWANTTSNDNSTVLNHYNISKNATGTIHSWALNDTYINFAQSIQLSVGADNVSQVVAELQKAAGKGNTSLAFGSRYNYTFTSTELGAQHENASVVNVTLYFGGTNFTANSNTTTLQFNYGTTHNISAFDTIDPVSSSAGSSSTFYVSFYNSTEPTAITDGTCTIGIFGSSFAMTYQAASARYEVAISMASRSTGTYTYNATCYHANYATQTNSSATISVQPGETGAAVGGGGGGGGGMPIVTNFTLYPSTISALGFRGRTKMQRYELCNLYTEDVAVYLETAGDCAAWLTPMGNEDAVYITPTEIDFYKIAPGTCSYFDLNITVPTDTIEGFYDCSLIATAGDTSRMSTIAIKVVETGMFTEFFASLQQKLSWAIRINPSYNGVAVTKQGLLVYGQMPMEIPYFSAMVCLALLIGSFMTLRKQKMLKDSKILPFILALLICGIPLLLLP